jgi:transcription elongation GreA/GreB family factor
MQAEINKARLITPELCRSDEQVTVGSAARARNRDTGQEKTFVFLGPWDADHDKGIYSYSATLGLVFMGKKKGEVATHSTDREEETWEIVEIRPLGTSR